MKVLIPPAKNFKMKKLGAEISVFIPEHIDKSQAIIDKLSKLSIYEIIKVLNVSDSIATKAALYYQNFDYTNVDTPAILNYDGQLYKSLNADDLKKDDIAFANDVLRITSSLYGVLKPLDAILPYRLELNCKFEMNGKNLYDYWEGAYYKSVFKKKGEIVLSLLSGEYEKAILKYLKPGDNFYKCTFLCKKNGGLKSLPIFAKRGRGAMARFIILDRIENIEDIKRFNGEGFRYDSYMSTDRNFVFIK